MVKSLFKMFKKPGSSKELLTELDVSRVTGVLPMAEEVEASADVTSPEIDVENWKQSDLDLLQLTWEGCCQDPNSEDANTAFRTALHNLHGASGAYGGGALTRLSGSLHMLVSGVEDLQAEAPLINLHVQACRATGIADTDASDEIADAVCDALEKQVTTRISEAAAA
ncbi:MAG: hypothetical protein Hens2KO_27340 [Henriciella sp.]